jgi:hypothetical protein
VELVCDAVDDGSAAAINAAKDTLAGFNELGAGLDQFGRCAEDVMPLLVTKGSLVTQSFVVSAASQSDAETSVDASVTDAALALAGSDSPTSATTTSSVEALDVAFGSVDGSDDLLMALPLGSGDEDDALAEDQWSADDDAEDESFGSLDDVFELLSVA